MTGNEDLCTIKMITTVQVLAMHYYASVLTAMCVILYVLCRAFSVLQKYSSVQLWPVRNISR